jgi:hypothetical protein
MKNPLKRTTPLFPVIVASVIASFIAIPFNGSNLETMVVVPLLCIAVGAFARQREIRDQRNRATAADR